MLVQDLAEAGLAPKKVKCAQLEHGEGDIAQADAAVALVEAQQPLTPPDRSNSLPDAAVHPRLQPATTTTTTTKVSCVFQSASQTPVVVVKCLGVVAGVRTAA